MMSETTEILFNSPALRSLRRDQLQRLCKIHSIKANGKNTELVDRLRQHASMLPKDDPLSIAARSEMDLDEEDEDEDEDGSGSINQNQNQRPSDQWEVVMESIQEVEEASPATLTSLRTPATVHSSDEFGTVNSKAPTAVGLSIRALATSLGLKRTLKSDGSSVEGSSKAIGQSQQPDDELTQHSIPYSAIRAATPPLHDNFTFDPTTAAHTRMSYDTSGEPLPGCSQRPGEPAPDNARLSMGLGPAGQRQRPPQQPDNKMTPTKERLQPTTTIRLVSSKSSLSSIVDNSKPEFESRRDTFQTPKLKRFETTFDLVMSPSVDRIGAFWAPDAQPGPFEKMYPTLTIDDLPPDVPPSPIKRSGDKANSTNKDKGTLGVPSTTTASSDPFVFGSPLHSVSNTQFQAAAASVLEEMNKRLGISGIEGVGMDIVNKLQPGAHTQAQLVQDMKSLPSRLNTGDGMKGGEGEIAKKFDDIHKAEFDKMEGIDGAVKRRMERKKSSSSFTTAQVAGKKRKSNVLGELGGKPRRLASGPASAANANAVDSGSSSAPGTNNQLALPGGFGDQGEEEGEERGGKRPRIDFDTNTKEAVMDVDEVEVKRDQEHERGREAKAIKRKLEISRAKRRSSVGGAVAAVTKSAAVRRSAKLPPPATPKSKSSSKFGFLTSAAKSLVASVWNRGKTPASKSAAAATTGVGAPTKSSLLKRKEGATGFAPTKSSVNFTATTATATTNMMATGNITNTAASVNTTNAATATTGNGHGATRPTANQLSVMQPQEQKDVSGFGRARSKSPIPPSFNNVTQATTSSLRTSSVASGSGSGGIGIKPSGTTTKVVPKTASGSGSTSSRTSSLASSRLFAPTASSLAKMKSPTAMTTSLLEPITNSPRIGYGQASPSKRSRGGVLSPKGLHGLRKVSVFSPKSNAANTKSGVMQGRIFSKPVTATGLSGIPVLKKTIRGNGGENEDVEMGDDDDDDAVGGNNEGVPKTPATVRRQRTFTRKPRISRSKVIGKLASQRAAFSSSFRPTASSSSTATIAKLSALPSAPRTKPGSSSSHIGADPMPVPRTPRAPAVTNNEIRAKRMRPSFAPVRGHVRGGSVDGIGVSGGGGGAKERSVLASAKKRIRQSEYARRKSARMSGVPSLVLDGDD